MLPVPVENATPFFTGSDVRFRGKEIGAPVLPGFKDYYLSLTIPLEFQVFG